MKKEDLDKLEEYARLEGTEIGELCNMRVEIYQSYMPYLHSVSFEKAIEIELSVQLRNFMKHSKIVEHEVQVINKWKGLEWD